jgi:acyl-CoA dehydrogenase
MAGKGSRMLIEQLSVGRCISLPASATGGAVSGIWATGACAHPASSLACRSAASRASRHCWRACWATATSWTRHAAYHHGADDGGEKPASCAILKYHVTELGRQVADDAMDIHGGKAVMLGPRNYVARAWQSTPIGHGVAVEGANLLTRNLIIFRPGRHPLPSIRAGRNRSRARQRHTPWRGRLRSRAVFAHRLCVLQCRALTW